MSFCYCFSNQKISKETINLNLYSYIDFLLLSSKQNDTHDLIFLGSEVWAWFSRIFFSGCQQGCNWDVDRATCSSRRLISEALLSSLRLLAECISLPQCDWGPSFSLTVGKGLSSGPKHFLPHGIKTSLFTSSRPTRESRTPASKMKSYTM